MSVPSIATLAAVHDRSKKSKAPAPPVFTYTKQGEPHATLNNAIEAIRPWRGVLAFDTFASEIVTTEKPPWGTADVPRDWKPGPWGTREDVLTCSWLSRTYGIRVGLDVVRYAVGNVADHTKVHPVTDWFDGLRWDGTERAPFLFSRYFGATHNEYTAEVSRIFLVGAVARVRRPGCKLDTMVVLEGEQGIRKSTGIKTIVGAEWFSDTPIDLASKDRFVALRNKFGIEIAELDGFDKHEATRIKAFISSPVDTYRAPYARSDERFERQCFFVGTTNAKAYLSDPTGNRRFLPVACTVVDLKAIRRDRSQLWAEADQRFQKGETWWPDRAVVDLFAAEQEARVTEDSWEHSIAEHMANRNETTMRDLLERALGILDEAKHTIADQKRAARILSRLGFERVQRRTAQGRSWVYVARGVTTKPEVVT